MNTEKAIGRNGTAPKVRPPPPPAPPKPFVRIPLGFAPSAPWPESMFEKELEDTEVVRTVRNIEQQGKGAIELAGEILATLHVNRLRQTIKASTPEGEKDLDKLMEAWRKRLAEL